jgi:hypothetical protein
MSVVFVAFLFLCFFPLYLITVATKEQRDCYFSKLFIYSGIVEMICH